MSGRFSDEQFDEIEKRDTEIFRQHKRSATAEAKRLEKWRAAMAKRAEMEAKYPPCDKALPEHITPEWLAYRWEQDVDDDYHADGPYREYEIAKAIFRAIAADDSSPWQAVAKVFLK